MYTKVQSGIPPLLAKLQAHEGSRRRMQRQSLVHDILQHSLNDAGRASFDQSLLGESNHGPFTAAFLCKLAAMNKEAPPPTGKPFLEAAMACTQALS